MKQRKNSVPQLKNPFDFQVCRILFFFSVTIVITLGYAQDTIPWKLRSEYPISTPLWRINNFGNIVTSRKSEIYVHDALGNELFKQSIKSLGQIQHIDASNTLKTLLFSEEQQSISFIDNTLTKQQNVIDLNGLGFSYVTLACASAQVDRFWVFDQDNSTLALVAANNAIQQRILNLNQLLNIQHLTAITERNSLLYLLDEQKGVFIFDQFGSFVSKWEFSGGKAIEVNNEMVYILSENALYIIDTKRLDTKQVVLPLTGIVSFQVANQGFYFFGNGKLFLYSVDNISK